MARLRALPAPGEAPRSGTPPQRPAGTPPERPAVPLPEGAAVLVAWPPGALPEELLRAYGQGVGAGAGLGGESPMAGYLVLVPAGPALEQAAEPDGADGIRLDRERRTAHVDGRPLDLTYLEFELLAHLTAHPQRVHTRDSLVTAVWGYGHVGDGRTVDVHVARLRRKLGPRHRGSIVTVRRVGYKYAPGAGTS
ncbi:winged helix-turn-helix domain-containing protein [Phaeacidiphilus oryzae]|uniref:winged helix-turn-helix domain-containing protein n=1 Tax=Phaeacidiphilus oryzae TaxID=348818 RepID=UPI00190F297B